MVHTVALSTSLWAGSTELDVFRVSRGDFSKSSCRTCVYTRTLVKSPVEALSALVTRRTVTFVAGAMTGIALAINNVFTLKKRKQKIIPNNRRDVDHLFDAYLQDKD